MGDGSGFEIATVVGVINKIELEADRHHKS